MTLDAQTQTPEMNRNSLLANAAEGQYVESATPPSETEQDVQILSVATIHKREGHNPRRIRAKAKTNELRESIRAKGVIQAILVRPHPEKAGEYELVAGETRLDLTREVGRNEIPAVIRNLTDEEMLDFASTENTQRVDMSPVDEGLAAQELMAQGKDKEEVCRIMGWKLPLLEGRIQLTHCIDEVSQALVDDQIALGHAQLLSGLRPESQKNALAATLKNGFSVEQLREAINQLSLTLKAAPFDLTECQTCPHNSSTQASLFADSKAMGKAKCLNKACFDKKTQDHLDALKADLAESHHKVLFSHEVATGTTTVIVPTGTHGVGEDQATACQSCEHFGATIDSAMGSKAAVTKNVCFNMPCHTTKVKEYRNVIATDASPTVGTGKTTATTQPQAEAPTKDTMANAKSATQKATKAPSKKTKPDVAKSAIPRKVVDHHHQIHRTAAAATVTDDNKAVLIISLLSLMADANVEPDKKPEGWPTSLTGENRAKAAAMLDTLSMEQLAKLQRKLAAKAMQKAKSQYAGENEKDSFGSVALWIAKSRSVDLTKHFTMDAEYLSPFTKPMIAERLEKSGFASDYDKQEGEKAFAKLSAGKKGDLLKAVEDSKYDFSGYLPEGLKL